MSSYRPNSAKKAGRTTDKAVIAAAKRNATPLVAVARSMRGGRINLKAVSEVLSERGLDPTVEITRILETEDENGKPVLDHDTRIRVLMELLQYTQPKLKSVEIRAKVAATAFDVNDEQAKRIAEEFLKASAAGAT